MLKPKRHIWEEGSTHRAVAGKEYDEVWDYVAALEAELEQWQVEAKDESDGVSAGGRRMTKMENHWMDEKKQRLELERALKCCHDDNAVMQNIIDAQQAELHR